MTSCDPLENFSNDPVRYEITPGLAVLSTTPDMHGTQVLLHTLQMTIAAATAPPMKRGPDVDSHARASPRWARGHAGTTVTAVVESPASIGATLRTHAALVPRQIIRARHTGATPASTIALHRAVREEHAPEHNHRGRHDP